MNMSHVQPRNPTRSTLPTEAPGDRLTSLVRLGLGQSGHQHMPTILLSGPGQHVDPPVD